jgi:hypothetical protein
MNIRDALVAATVFAFSLAAFVMAGNFGGGSGTFPRVITIVMMLSAAVLLVRSFVRMPTEADLDDEISSDDRRLTMLEVVRVALAIILTIAYIALIVPLGFFTASALYIVISAYALGLRNHLAIWLTLVIYLGGAYFLFEHVFFTPLPEELINRLM